MHKKLVWLDKKCTICGKVFKRPKNYSTKTWKTAKYCSKACWNIRGKHPVKNCNFCGKEFSLPAHLMKLGTERERRACSRKCSYMLITASNSYLWKGKHANYERFSDALRNTNLYRNWRLSIKKRDNNKCVNCGKEDNFMHVHHIYPLKQIIKDEGWNMSKWTELHFSPNSRLWDMKNGVTICSDCHYSLISYALQAKGYSPRRYFPAYSAFYQRTKSSLVFFIIKSKE